MSTPGNPPAFDPEKQRLKMEGYKAVGQMTRTAMVEECVKRTGRTPEQYLAGLRAVNEICGNVLDERRVTTEKLADAIDRDVKKRAQREPLRQLVASLRALHAEDAKLVDELLNLPGCKRPRRRATRRPAEAPTLSVDPRYAAKPGDQVRR